MAPKPKSRVTIGLISDTHGLLRPEALRALSGVQHIIHAGDIGGPEILAQLRTIAPVDAVRGNNDKGDWAAAVPLTLALRFEGVDIHVLHAATGRSRRPFASARRHRPRRSAVRESGQRRTTTLQAASVDRLSGSRGRNRSRANPGDFVSRSLVCARTRQPYCRSYGAGVGSRAVVTASSESLSPGLPERRPAIWPWLVMPLVTLSLYYTLDQLKKQHGGQQSSSSLSQTVSDAPAEASAQ
jgi:hypothetical protein